MTFNSNKQNNLKISVIVPSRNQGIFIESTLNSILNQTYQNIEIIVIDCCSADETLSILERYSDKITWVSELDSGQAEAINKGFSACSGDIITFLNSDDIFVDVWAIQKIVTAFCASPSLDLIYGDFLEIDAENKVLRAYKRPNFSLERLLRIGYISQPATFFRKKVFLEVPMVETLHYALDLELWLSACRKGFKFGSISCFVAGERLHNEAKSISQNAKQVEEAIQIREKYGARFDRQHHFMRFIDRIVLYTYRILGLVRLVRVTKHCSIALDFKGSIFRTISPQKLPDKFV